MEIDDMLKEMRDGLIEQRERLKEYKKLWSEPEKMEPAHYNEYIKNTFLHLINIIGKQLKSVEQLYILSSMTVEKTYIHHKFINNLLDQQSKIEFSNEIRKFGEVMKSQSESFLKHLDT